MSAQIVERQDEIQPGQFCPLEKSKAATASVVGDPLQTLREKAPERHRALLLILRGGALG
jgi:hypothetical protein